MTVSVLVLVSQRVSQKLSLLVDRHGFSDTYVDTVQNSNPRFGLIFQQRFNLDFSTVSSVFVDFGSNHLYEFLIDLEATFILGITIDFLLLLVTEEHRRIVQLRLISNLLRSIVWITSGLLIISQIVAHILAIGFPVALHWVASLREEVGAL